MSAVREIEEAIARLSEQDLAVLRGWLEEFDAKIWDEQFEDDAQSGKLDSLADKAIADFHAGKCQEV